MKSVNFYKHILLLLAILITLTLYNGYAQEISAIPDFSPKPSYVGNTDTPIVSLNGKWQFLVEPPAEFWKSPKKKNVNWDEIQVPGEWVMQGFDVKPNTMAAYYKEILVPDSWKDHLIQVKCDGIYSLAKVYVNGKYAGSHEGGFTPFQLNLTDLIKPGKKNTVIIGVQNESLADTLASATQYAAHSLGGITRKIELFALPKVHIKSAHYTTLISDNNHDTELIVDLLLANSGRNLAEEMTVSLDLKNNNNPSILFPDNSHQLPPIPSGNEIKYQPFCLH